MAEETQDTLTKQKFIVKGAWATCIFGVTPAMFDTILDNMFVNFNGKLTATSMSLGPCFPPPGFGMCKMVPNMPRPCTCQIVKWDLSDNSKTINRIAHPLTKMSRGQCALGTPMCISFTMEGQTPKPGTPDVADMCAAFAPELTPLVQNILEKKVPQITNIKTLNSNGKPIDTVPENGLVTLVAETINHQVGDRITFDIDGIGTFETYITEGNDAKLVCHFISKEEIKSGFVPRRTVQPDNVAEPLKKSKDIAKLLKALGRDVWDKPNDGFESDLRHGKVDLKGLTREQFLELYKRTSKCIEALTYGPKNHKYFDIDGNPPTTYGPPLDEDTHRKLLDIRKTIFDNEHIDENTVFQKVVCTDANLAEWITKTNNYAKSNNVVLMYGSTLVAKDGKHLKTPEDLYDGLQLNYSVPAYNAYYPPEKPQSIYVVRYTAINPDAAKIPVHNKEELPDNPDGYRKSFYETKGRNQYPFTGNGNTPAHGKDSHGIDRVGTPELMIDGDNGGQKVKQAILVRIDPDGTETIVGYQTNPKSGPPQFVCYDQNGDKVKPLSDAKMDELAAERKKRAEEEMAQLEVIADKKAALLNGSTSS